MKVNANLLNAYRQICQKSAPTMKSGERKLLSRAMRLLLNETLDSPKLFNCGIMQEFFGFVHHNVPIDTKSIISVIIQLSTPAVPVNIIEQEFGTEIAEIVCKVRKIRKFPFSEQVMGKAEDYFILLTKHVRALIVRIVLHLYEMLFLDSISKDMAVDCLLLTERIYVPLTSNLGLEFLSRYMSNLKFKTTNRDMYKLISQRINDYSDYKEYISDFISPIEERLRKLELSYEIKSRIKSVSSIWDKMIAKNLQIDSISDIIAIRIIIDVPIHQEKMFCWKIHELVTDLYRVNPDKFRNWISYPKKNGYSALQIVVCGKKNRWVEVQIRSRRMDKMAEEGASAHWQYKHKYMSSRLTEITPWLYELRNFFAEAKKDQCIWDQIPKSKLLESICVVSFQDRPIELQSSNTLHDLMSYVNPHSKWIGVYINGIYTEDMNYVFQDGDVVTI